MLNHGITFQKIEKEFSKVSFYYIQYDIILNHFIFWFNFKNSFYLFIFILCIFKVILFCIFILFDFPGWEVVHETKIIVI